jgi:hypothetical protein
MFCHGRGLGSIKGKAQCFRHDTRCQADPEPDLVNRMTACFAAFFHNDIKDTQGESGFVHGFS